MIGCLNSILWRIEITKTRKLKIYRKLTKSGLIYGAETWRLPEKNKKKLEVVEMDAIRKAARISRRDRVKNEEVNQRMGIE